MDALDDRDLATCVRCGLCLTACPTFRLTGMEGYSPRGRIASAATLGRDAARSSPVVSEYLDTCLGCLACEAVCPSGVPYERILEGARDAVPPGGPLRRVVDTIVLWVVARRWRLSVASLPLWLAQRLGLLRGAAWLARRGWVPGTLANASGIPKLRLSHLLGRMSTNYVPPDGVEERGQVVLFTGCVQDAWARDVHWATISLFTRLGYRIRVPHGQVCCGALHAHAGRLRWAERLARRNVDPLEEFRGQILVNAAGCGLRLKNYQVTGEGQGANALAARAKDWSELLSPDEVAEAGPVAPPGVEKVAVHDPCHLVHGQGISAEPRALLRAAGYEVVDLDDGGRCCGAAGMYAVHHPDWAAPLRTDKLDACRRAEADVVAVANPGCGFWMSASPDAPRMYHPVELVAMAVLHGTQLRREDV